MRAEGFHDRGSGRRLGETTELRVEGEQRRSWLDASQLWAAGQFLSDLTSSSLNSSSTSMTLAFT
jgi:hypothetical protein